MAAFEGRDKLQPPVLKRNEGTEEKCVQVKGVAHDKAFSDQKCYEEIVKLVKAAYNQLSRFGLNPASHLRQFGLEPGTAAKATKEWLDRCESVKWTVSSIW